MNSSLKITVIGGGPAGLFFASIAKLRMKDADITVVEKKGSGQGSEGLGYTLQDRTKEILALLDSDYFSNLFKGEDPPYLHQCLVRVAKTSRKVEFLEGHGMRRTALVNYLIDKARTYGVRIATLNVGGDDIDKFRRESDLVIGADGLNSIVRAKYKNDFEAKEDTGNTVYIWLSNVSVKEQSDVKFLVNNYRDSVLLFTSYPLSSRTQAVIIEMTMDSFKKSGLDTMIDKSEVSAKGIKLLEEVFSAPDDPLSLRSIGMKWAPYITNHCGQLYRDNVALIGDAAISFHYSLGAGLNSAFGMGHILSKHLSLGGHNPRKTLERFSWHVKSWLASSYKASVADLHWLGKIDALYWRIPHEHFIDAYLEKSNFNDTLWRNG